MAEVSGLEYLEFLIRMLSAFLAGGVIGLQRERAEKPAGLRTHILVCSGACLITLASIFGFSGLGSDPSRIIGHIVSGIGFLGAGTIFRHGKLVTGLTTAASLWATCGIGIVFGTGMYLLGILGVGFVLLALVALGWYETYFGRKGLSFLKISVVDQPGSLGVLTGALGELEVDIKEISLSKEKEGQLVDCLLQVDIPAGVSSTDLLKVLGEIELVKEIEIR